MPRKSKGTVLVTGGAGYIGSHANKELTRQGWDTVVYDNLVHGHRDAVRWGTFILGDLADREQLRLVFRKYRIGAVLHFAAYADVGESVREPGKYYVNNVANTITLLETMREHSCRHIVFSSTCATYGTPERMPVAEDQPQNPINPYGRSKLMVEQMLEDYSRAYGMTYVTLRYFNVAGADPEGEIGAARNECMSLIPIILTAADHGDLVDIFGTDYPTPDGTCIRDYIHVTDVSNAHIRALEHLLTGKASDAFNLGTGRGYSVMDVITCAERIVGKKISIAISGRRAGDPIAMIADNRKALTANMLVEGHLSQLETMIETAWKWHLKDKIEYVTGR